jgi:hypothetical protein
VPLNENEERILQEIERQFHADDPDSARRLGSMSLPRYLARNCRWSAIGFVAGLVILVVAFASNWIIGVFGFLVMVVCGVVLIQNVRKMSRLGIQHVSKSLGAHTFSDAVDDATRRLRGRFRKDED